MRPRLGAAGIVTAAIAAVGVVGLPATAGPSGATTADAASVYVVVLRPAPLATFAGNSSFEPTIPATAPASTLAVRPSPRMQRDSTVCKSTSSPPSASLRSCTHTPRLSTASPRC